MIQLVVYRGGMVYAKNGPRLAHSVSALLLQHQAVVAQFPESERYNIFYTLGHHSGVDAASFPQRTATTFSYQNVLAWDIDHIDTEQPVAYAMLLAQLLWCKAEDLSIVASGYGVHLIVNLKANCTIRSAEYFKKNESAYKEIARKLSDLMKGHELPGKVDVGIFEPARVLRLPGTINKKEGRADAECRLIHASETLLELDIVKLSGLAEIASENISPIEVRRQYPRPDFEAMFDGCIFMQWAVHTPAEVHEPHVFDLFSLLSNVQPAAKVMFNDLPIGPQELGRYVFDRAVASNSLKGTTFEEKWDNASRYGARKCTTIDGRWDGRCKECPNYSKVPTPLALKGPDHIGSDVNGYWMLDGKGRHKHPNYADLAKLYLMQHSYVTGRGERMLVFDKTHYKLIEPLAIKAWLQRTVTPADSLREMHRMEFLAQIKVIGEISNEAEDHLFNESVRGKLNCANGVLDIKTGELLPHTPSLGFQYVLPYDYKPDGASEYFLTWLERVTEHRVELMESILDVMAYCLWPSYDDHTFTFLVGEGSNGKSTVIDVISAILGEKNYAALNIHQLTRNRFYPAELEGKLANICEESSGDDLDSEQLNILKNLSAGGQMMAERKNKQGYLFRNKAKLIFSANKVPKFHETNEAIKRRLVVIPFDNTIRPEERDPRVKEKLVSEAPLILPMLIKRIQENIKLNGGKFVISRESQIHTQAQKNFLLANNPIKEWAEEMLETTTSLHDFVQVNECYSSYREWCERNGYRHIVPTPVFGRTMVSLILPRGLGSELKKVAGKPVRIYRRTKFKNQEGVSHDGI